MKIDARVRTLEDAEGTGYTPPWCTLMPQLVRFHTSSALPGLQAWFLKPRAIISTQAYVRLKPDSEDLILP